MSNFAPPVYTGFEVKVEHSPLAFLYALCPVYVVINGTKMTAKWGAQFYPAVPGRYNIQCFCSYMFTPQTGLNGMEGDLYPGQVVRVTWTAPLVVFMKGKMRWELISGPTAGSLPPGR